LTPTGFENYTMQLAERIKSAIRDVNGYPRPGIVFKDITPLLSDSALVRDVIAQMVTLCRAQHVDAVAAIEARGFILGGMLAHELGCSFIPVRKSGKLPFTTRKQQYSLEYGTSEIEIHSDAVKPGSRVLVHDDLLATGGTASAAAKLIKGLGGELAGFLFLINLSFLPGAKNIAGEFGVAPDFLIKY
jgi:adenine phosphoribosyltransferase